MIRLLCSLALGSALSLAPPASGTPQAPSPQDAPSRIDAIFQPWNKPDSPGASVAVVKDGQIVFEKGYGLANLEDAAPITADTVFHAASVSKQFTAMALVLLEQDGKIALDDDIRKHLPELPDYGRTITGRHLLQHTGGIRDQWQTLAIAGWRMDDVITQDQILRVLVRQKELNFTPGTEWLYSNGGYTLAAEIVRRASGKTLRAFCDERIFAPLGMTRTHVHDDLKMIVPHRAVSYQRGAKGLENAPLNYENVGATSLFTTAGDLARWLDNFRDARVGGRAAIDRLQEQGVLTGGTRIPYAFGVAIDEYRGLRRVSHSGGDAGFRSYAAWFPDVSLGVALVSNLGNLNAQETALRVAEAFVESRMKPKPAASSPPPAASLTVDPRTLARYTGLYQLPETGIVKVEARDGKLLASPAGQPPQELVPVADGRFLVRALNLEVTFSRDAATMQILVRQGGGQTDIRGERIATDAEAKAPVSLADYVGMYWSDEVETQYAAIVREGKLKLQHIRHGDIELTLLFGDRFRGGVWFAQDVRFMRDAQGRVTGARLGGGRVRGILFTRKS